MYASDIDLPINMEIPAMNRKAKIEGYARSAQEGLSTWAERAKPLVERWSHSATARSKGAVAASRERLVQARAAARTAVGRIRNSSAPAVEFGRQALGRVTKTQWWAGGITVLLFGLAVIISEPKEEPVSVIEPTRAEEPPKGPTREELALAAFERARPLILAAEVESQRELTDRLTTLAAWFDGRKAAVEPFAKDITSMESQFTFVGGLAEQLLENTIKGVDNASQYLFETKLLSEDHRPPEDRFAQHVRDRFRAHLLDPDELKRAMESAVSGYTTRLKAIENGLIVELKADLPDGAVGGKATLDVGQFQLPDQIEGLVSETTNIVGGDLIVAVIVDQVADQIGNVVAALIKGLISEMGGDISKVKGLETTIDMGADVGIGQAISKGLESQGYDPGKQIGANVEKCLDGVKNSVIKGEPNIAECYSFLLVNRFGHPDPSVRESCEPAIQAIERDARLGLASRLYGLHIRRAVQRIVAIHRSLLGEEAPALNFFPEDPRTKFPAADVLKLSRDCTANYGVKKP